MNKILVPCDFSAQAMSAVKMAAEIATQSDSALHILNVVEVPLMHDSMLMPTLSFEEETMSELRKNALTQFEKIKAEYSSLQVVTEVLYGGPAAMISDYIEDKQIELVVMGTKGASGLRELLIGSTAEKVVRGATCPVITVRVEVSPKVIRNIVVPNSLEPEQEILVTRLKQLQQMLKATLHIVWINTPANFTPDNITTVRLKDFAQRYMLTNFTLNIYNDIEEKTGVINFAKQKEADMIAMGTHGRKGISHLLIGSIAEDVVNHVQIPIWTTHLDAR
ncbi:universal stress protein [Chryseolinea sp. T2]|uniref:universal stress protein n=1 Tax=Chryseolinea sp. T2 TaxID=3129255 RepID=UPI0030774A39